MDAAGPESWPGGRNDMAHVGHIETAVRQQPWTASFGG
jgi:hypothetical protein